MPKKSKGRDPTKHIDDHIVAAMKIVGIHESMIYAYKKTGLLLAQSQMRTYPPDAVKEWNSAVYEWHVLFGPPDETPPDDAE